MFSIARIGIFGGTFNPIHNGHVLALKEFYKRLQLDRVLVIPAAIPPHKALPQGSPDAQTRLGMVRAALAGLDFVTVSDLEIRRSGKSYTSDTLRQLRAQFPRDQLLLLMGTDSYLKLPSWHEPETVLALSTVVCAHRHEDRDGELLRQQQNLLARFGARTVLLDNSFVDISSSTVRRMLAFGCGEPYVPASVMAQIDREALYHVHADWKQLPMERLKECSLQLHKKSRRAHALGCCETAVRLAEQYGADPVAAARAGILHDITKALDGPEQLQLCKKYDILISNLEAQNEKLLHAKTGAEIARRIFGESELVCDAIYWHTTGKADMTLLEKIIYLADYIEPTRDFDGVENLRALAWTDLDAAVLAGLASALELVRSRGKQIDPNSQAAWEFLAGERMVL